MAVKMSNGTAVLDIERFEVAVRKYGGTIVNIGLARFDGLVDGNCIVRMCFADKEVDEYMVSLQYNLNGSMQFHHKMVKFESFEEGGVVLLEGIMLEKKKQLVERKGNKKERLIVGVERILREGGTSMEMAKAVVEYIEK